MSDYRLIAKIKNARLWRAIRMVYPDVASQREAAKRLRISPGLLGNWLAMNVWPGGGTRLEKTGTPQWSPIAQRVAKTLRETPEYLFDPTLYSRRPRIVEVELSAAQLQGAGLLALPPSQDDLIEQGEARALVASALDTLSPRERLVLRKRFGFDSDGEERTLLEVGEDLQVGPERVRQIEARALRKLRHPQRTKALRSWLTP